MVAVETDEEDSLPESLPSQVFYAPEDEDFEEEEEDAVVPQYFSNPAETPLMKMTTQIKHLQRW